MSVGFRLTSWRQKDFCLRHCVLLLAACTAGNGEGLDANGQPIPDQCRRRNSDFQEIQDTVFTPICTQCHIGASAPHGLRLDAANSYALLVNVASDEVPTLLRVNPGNPDQSYIVQKIEGHAAVGGRMPLGQAPLPQDRIDLIRSWIAAGALPAAVASDRLTVSSSIPAAGEVAAAGIDKLTVIFAGEVDASLAAQRHLRVARRIRPGRAARAGRACLQGRPNVVELTLARGLAAGSYQLTVRGEGPVALADNAGHVLDGDADGVAGWRFPHVLRCQRRSGPMIAVKSHPIAASAGSAAVAAADAGCTGQCRALPGGADGPEVRAVPRESHRRRHAQRLRQYLRADRAGAEAHR